MDHGNTFLELLPVGCLIEGAWSTNKVKVDGQELDLRRSLKVLSKSPTGFNWGYGGAGPSQFAFALLYKYLPADIALEYYQDLKFSYIGGLPQSDFTVIANLREIVQKIIDKRKIKE